ncbi:unnamed protein product [Schistosoma margrebowiei]|uniref:Uncharacterized protein n=1 Tax=Schistosoma margrebowiei TaxID=48269 RepID=A0A3P8DVI8_9TREM|nr:unnamed protein product [Schistosoma margrebowiei]
MPILAFTSASEPPCSSMLLPSYVKDSTFSRVSPSRVIGLLFFALREEKSTLEDNWKGIKEELIPTYQEVLGLKKHHYKELTSVETLDKIQETRNKKIGINNSRTRSIQTSEEER